MPTEAQEKTSQNQQGGANAVVWVEIPVADLERAKKFYGSVFGFTFQMHDSHGYKMAMFNASQEKYGCGGALIQGETYAPSYDGAVVYFATPDIEGSLKKAVQAGGKLVQDKKSIGQYGFIAFFEDSEGNRIALHAMA